MLKQNTNFHNISITYDKKWARIKVDSNLFNFLSLPGNGSLSLADHILKEYQEIYNIPLDISRDSLAIEILAHTYAEAFSNALTTIGKKLPNDKLKALLDILEKIKEHTEIIDCGEKSVDSNRNIWDMLEPLHTLIYLALGRHA